MKTFDPHSDERLDRLFAQARAFPPDTAATEYALETRVLARVREYRERAEPQPWTSLSWKFLPFFASIVLVTAFWAQQSFQTADDAERLFFDTNSHTLSLWEAVE